MLAKDHRAAFVDAKSTSKTNFTYSDVTDHQVRILREIESQRFPAGYLVHFRQTGRVVFFSASELLALKPRESLSDRDGLCIGTINTLSLVTIFDWGIK
jgi:penicillin-binding protein-related factor A (putative recombinase)